MTLLWTYSGIEFDIYASVSPIADADFRSFRVGERHFADITVMFPSLIFSCCNTDIFMLQ
jgi:hypothetical protein